MGEFFTSFALSLTFSTYKQNFLTQIEANPRKNSPKDTSQICLEHLSAPRTCKEPRWERFYAYVGEGKGKGKDTKGQEKSKRYSWHPFRGSPFVYSFYPISSFPVLFFFFQHFSLFSQSERSYISLFTVPVCGSNPCILAPKATMSVELVVLVYGSEIHTSSMRGWDPSKMWKPSFYLGG